MDLIGFEFIIRSGFEPDVIKQMGGYDAVYAEMAASVAMAMLADDSPLSCDVLEVAESPCAELMELLQGPQDTAPMDHVLWQVEAMNVDACNTVLFEIVSADLMEVLIKLGVARVDGKWQIIGLISGPVYENEE